MTLVMYHPEYDDVLLYLGKDPWGRDCYLDDEGECSFLSDFAELIAITEWQIIGVLE